ncbi:serine/threonine-protein phosphatase 7 long form homolog [Solanum pennellii]|uniref:Serine/threonine-protein phosphatase 7 long form homolog n=1 Tax=Solanum pennellii TaxID=28526 RepID=A0ABM1V0E9_SOLPN|nr:serine/threonine-protein phosphatase 7 long form homolog [Solanum pennellii]
MANDSEYKLDPGPLESNVLTGQLTHRSQDIWEGNVNMILNTRREDGNFWKLIEKYPIHPRVLEVIRLSGLYGVYKSNRPAIDCSLITALVERWRPETHTFHFRTGEATITLQDVEVLYGLPVNGDPVLGNEMIRTIEDWQNICQRLLGFVPSREDFKTNSIKVAAFNSHMLSQPHLSNMATQDMVNQKARCYMFWMIAGMMMADTSGGYLKLMYLPMLEDVDKIGSYSWGSATLAYLYHFLCKASQSTQNEIAGFLPLLQIWAWERVTVLRPQIVAHRDARTICHVGLPRGPHATRWFAHLSWTNTTKHVLKVYRDALDSMIEDQFIWEPYSDDLIESLPLYCHAGRDIWRVRVPIFCWDVVEVHLPDRVMRQFGLQQAIPTPFPFDSNHFRHDRRGRPNTNWELEHAHWLSFWNQRLQYSCDAPVNNEPLRYDDPYLIWFRRITRLVIGNPNSRPQNQQGYVPNSTAYETMVRHIHSMVDEAKTLGDNPSYEALYMFRKMVRDQGSDCLKYVHEADRVHVSADYRRDVVQPVQLHHPVRRRGKGGVAGRRERAVERAQTHVEIDQATQNVQEALEDDQATSNYNIGSISGGCTHEFTQASNMTYQLSETDIMPYVTPQTLQISSHPSLSSLENVIGNFENVPNFTSSPVPLIIETPDATNNLEDPNHDVDDNDPKDANEGGDTTIQNSEPSRREKRKIKLKPCGTGGHYAIQHVQKKRAKNK